ncbi:MAG: hypothetical protein MK135_02370, partial [Polyangiaceae bacterium]|nr:hypothetical protein [Polyangiaceae bacterium]
MQPKQGYPELPLPEMSLSGPDILDALLAWMPLEAIAPLPILLIAAPPIWWLFRGTWKELAQESRAYLSHHPETDYRPYVSLCLLAVTLTLHEYYGGRRFFEAVWSPLLRNLEGNGWHWIQFNRYGKLWGYVWWSGARVFGYVAVPLLVWRLLFPKD